MTSEALAQARASGMSACEMRDTMFVRIDFDSEEAFYIQLRNQIIMGIAMSELQEGESLPSVRDLAESIGINMHTVNKAYTILKQEGYVRLDRRRGAVIAVDADKLMAEGELRKQLKTVVARALCKNLTPEEIRQTLDGVLEEFRAASEDE